MPDLTVSADIDSFMQSANKAAAVSFLGALTTTQIAGLSTTAPAALATAPVVGLSTFAARGDHQHIFPTAANVGALGATAAAGGDLTGNYPNPTLAAITTAQAGVGSSTQIPVLSIDAKGRVTALTSVTAAGGTATPTDVQVFTSSGTWTKPAGAVAVDVVIISGGGGGAGGRKGGATSVAPGGGGGAGGSYSMRSFAAAVLGASEPVAVGAGGTGGAAQTNLNANGFLGSPGGNSSFGTWAAVTEGLGAQTVTPGSAVPGSAASARAMFLGGSGGTGSFGAAPGTNGINSTAGSAGGGGGGGLILTPTTAIAGGAGGVALASFITGGQATAGTAGGGNGGAGPAATANTAIPGSGGAGGGSSITAANGGNGGAGGLYGGGGGGGGAGLDGVNNSGAGGNGASGIVIVTTYF